MKRLLLTLLVVASIGSLTTGKASAQNRSSGRIDITRRGLIRVLGAWCWGEGVLQKPDK